MGQGRLLQKAVWHGGLNTGSRENDSTSPCLSFFICQTGKVTVAATRAYGMIRVCAQHTEGTRNGHSRIRKSQALASASRGLWDGPAQAQFGVWKCPWFGSAGFECAWAPGTPSGEGVPGGGNVSHQLGRATCPWRRGPKAKVLVGRLDEAPTATRNSRLWWNPCR